MKIGRRQPEYWSNLLLQLIGNPAVTTPLDDPEYMRITTNLIPQECIDANGLTNKIKNGYIYMRIIKGIYGLQQSGKLANKLFKDCLELHNYYEVKHIPGPFTHTWRPMWFTVVVDIFGIKYDGEEHAKHVLSTYTESALRYEERLEGRIVLWNHIKLAL